MLRGASPLSPALAVQLGFSLIMEICIAGHALGIRKSQLSLPSKGKVFEKAASGKTVQTPQHRSVTGAVSPAHAMVRASRLRDGLGLAAGPARSLPPSCLEFAEAATRTH